MSTTPDDIIGAAGVKRLRAAGFDIVRREVETMPGWRCPHCGALHSPSRGQSADIFLDWGHAWHRPCVSPYQVAPSKRGDRLPMVECY